VNGGSVNGSGVIACVGEPLICFSATSMLDSPTAEVSEGGAEFNVAVHLARLGLGVRFVSAVGDDVLGRRIEARLRREGVDTSALRSQPGEHTGAYVKDPASGSAAYLRAGSAASKLTLAPDALDGVSHVHLTELRSRARLTGREAVVDHADERLARVVAEAFDLRAFDQVLQSYRLDEGHHRDRGPVLSVVRELHPVRGKDAQHLKKEHSVASTHDQEGVAERALTQLQVSRCRSRRRVANRNATAPTPAR
jgi:hypothetical protein